MSVRPPRLPCWLAALVLAALGAAATPQAAAFCGFFVAGSNQKLYNNASQVVLLRKGNHTVMTMSNNYKGPPEDFAMVVPVPVVLKKQQVRTPSAKVFAHVDELTAPRLVEYWEQDPCDNDGGNVSFGALGGRMAQRPKAARSRDDSAADYHVKIEAQFDVGEYDILILSAQQSTGLETWLRDNGYRIPAGASDVLGSYIGQKMRFFVAKVNLREHAASGVARSRRRKNAVRDSWRSSYSRCSSVFAVADKPRPPRSVGARVPHPRARAPSSWGERVEPRKRVPARERRRARKAMEIRRGDGCAGGGDQLSGGT